MDFLGFRLFWRSRAHGDVIELRILLRAMYVSVNVIFALVFVESMRSKAVLDVANDGLARSPSELGMRRHVLARHHFVSFMYHI